MDIFWGVVALVVVVGSTAAALAARREDPTRPWFPAGSDGAWPGARDARLHGERWERDARRLESDLRAASRPAEGSGARVDPHDVAAELVLRRVLPNRAPRDVQGTPAAARTGRRARLDS